MVPPCRARVHSVVLDPKLAAESRLVVLLRFVLIDLLVMFPTHSARVHSVVLDAKLSTETGLVIFLGLMLVDFLMVLPSYSALVLHAHPVLAPEALLVVGL